MPDPAVVWSFVPGGDYTEELAWLTDVLQAPTGGTQHRRLRESPRTTIGFACLEHGDDRRWLDAQLRQHSAALWSVPVPIDERPLSAAVLAGATVLPVDVDGARFVAGGRVLIIGHDPRVYEEGTIDSVGVSSLTLSAGLAGPWPANTRLIPLRSAYLADPPPVARYTSDASGLIPLRWRLIDPLDTAPALPGTPYRGHPVFDQIVPVWTSDPVWTPERRTIWADDDIAAPALLDTAGSALGKTVLQYAAVGAGEVASFRAALFALAGRWTPAWVPTWTHDLRLVAGVGAGQWYLDVDGPLLSGQPLPANRRDIRIQLSGGVVHYRRIAGVSTPAAGVDRLTLDAPLPAAIGLQDVAMVSFLVLSVQDSDTATLRYFDSNTLQCELVWRELAHEL